MIDDFNVSEELGGSDDLYKNMGDGELKPGRQAIYVDRYTLNKNNKSSSKYYGRPQLIINLLGCDDNVNNRGCEASIYFPVVTKQWAEEVPEMIRQGRFLKAFFTGLGIKDFKISELTRYLDDMRNMPFMADIKNVKDGFAQLETLGFTDGAAASTGLTDLPF
ncbi:MAG: hypothetical protein ABIK92_21720 [Pseudomonadota bacterium]